MSGGASSIEQRWIDAGGDALALLTAAVDSYRPGGEAGDGDFLRRVRDLLEDPDGIDPTMILAWLARLAAQSAIAGRGGDLEAVQSDLEGIGRELAAAQLEVAL